MRPVRVRTVRTLKSFVLDGVAGGVEEATDFTGGVQTFDDGSSLQTFDDGSMLATGNDGSLSSSTAATDYGTSPEYGNDVPTSTFHQTESFTSGTNPTGTDEQATSFEANNVEAPTIEPGGAMPSDDFLRGSAARMMGVVRGNPASFQYFGNGEVVDPALIVDGRANGQRVYSLNQLGTTDVPMYIGSATDPVTGENFREVRSTHALVNATPANTVARFGAGSVGGILAYEAANLALPYAQNSLARLEENGYRNTAATIRETGNIAHDFLVGAAPVATGVSAGLQYVGVPQRYADWAGIAADVGVRVFPPTGVVYNPASLALGSANATRGTVTRNFGG